MGNVPIGEAKVVEDSERAPQRSRALGALALLALLVVLVLVLLVLPRCTGDAGGDTAGADKKIIAVPDTPAEAGVVSVWIEDGRTIDEVVGKAGLSGATATDLGGGRFVVDVEPGTERESVKRLRDLPGVYDAGFVFEESAGTTAN